MSQWEALEMDAKIAEILDVESHEPGHHFGRPLVTPYQIAIEFRERFPEAYEQIGKPVGGKGTGQQDSLAQYIAQVLSSRIKSHLIDNIEGRFLYRGYLKSLSYAVSDELIESSTLQACDLSLYRLIES